MDQDAFQPTLPVDWPQAQTSIAEAVAALRTSNAEKYQALTAPSRDGRRAVPDPILVLALRLNTALEFLFADEDTRLRFDLAFEHRMQQALDQCLTDRRKQELLAPLTPQQPVPGSGLFLPKG